LLLMLLSMVGLLPTCRDDKIVSSCSSSPCSSSSSAASCTALNAFFGLSHRNGEVSSLGLSWTFCWIRLVFEFFFFFDFFFFVFFLTTTAGALLVALNIETTDVSSC
jgi:hypothetical protein